MPDPQPDPTQAAALAELEAIREAARVNDPYHYVRPEHELSERERLAEVAVREYAETPAGIAEAALAKFRAATSAEVNATLKAQADQIAADAVTIAKLEAQLAQIAADTKPATKDAGKVKTGGGMMQF